VDVIDYKKVFACDRIFSRKGEELGRGESLTLSQFSRWRWRPWTRDGRPARHCGKLAVEAGGGGRLGTVADRELSRPPARGGTARRRQGRREAAAAAGSRSGRGGAGGRRPVTRRLVAGSQRSGQRPSSTRAQSTSRQHERAPSTVAAAALHLSQG
jgi:hypothetical protein